MSVIFKHSQVLIQTKSLISDGRRRMKLCRWLRSKERKQDENKQSSHVSWTEVRFHLRRRDYFNLHSLYITVCVCPSACKDPCEDSCVFHDGRLHAAAAQFVHQLNACRPDTDTTVNNVSLTPSSWPWRPSHTCTALLIYL